MTLNLYSFPDPSGAVQKAVDNCSAASHGKYTIVYNQLQNSRPTSSGCRWRGGSPPGPSMDILGLDVTWEAEFATAGWIRPWTGTSSRDQGRSGRPLQTAIWRGKLVAVRTTATPSCSGTGPTW